MRYQGMVDYYLFFTNGMVNLSLLLLLIFLEVICYFRYRLLFYFFWSGSL